VINIFDEEHMSFWKELYDKFLPIINKVKASKELNDVSKEYEDNFEKLVDSVGTPNYKFYSDKEKELNLKDVSIRKRLRVLIPDPGMKHL
jgi:hypothetical protein